MKLGWGVFVAVGLQLVVIFASAERLDVLVRALFVLSYLILLLFAWLNRRHVGISVIGVGLLLNFLAIAANGGLMPISPQTMVRAGMEERVLELETGEHVPRSKNVLLEEEDTRLRFLSDTLALDNPFRVRAFSVGDTVIGAGLLITLGELFLPRLSRAPLKDERASKA